MDGPICVECYCPIDADGCGCDDSAVSAGYTQFQEGVMSEDDFAIREAEEVQAEDDYFAARPLMDSRACRKTFEAGFIRGYDKVRPKHPHGLSDAQIDEIARNMPGGMDGFLKGWGWMQFARAIEEAQGIGV